eukprot:COSAG02_NODE_2329_length_9121_cov_3.015183_13_plen_146_part_00
MPCRRLQAEPLGAKVGLAPFFFEWARYRCSALEYQSSIFDKAGTPHAPAIALLACHPAMAWQAAQPCPPRLQPKRKATPEMELASTHKGGRPRKSEAEKQAERLHITLAEPGWLVDRQGDDIVATYEVLLTPAARMQLTPAMCCH